MHPFTDNTSEAISSVGEVALLTLIRQWLGKCVPPPPQGMGDDCAVFSGCAQQQVLTTDSLIYQRHFDHTTPPRLAGAKLLKRNLSDIAAMGGIPERAVLAGCFPQNTSLAWLEDFVRGIGHCAVEYDVQMVGGDLAETRTELVTNLTLLGRCERTLLRSGGKSGDHIMVTGTLGGSIYGRHLHFIPRLTEGHLLAADPNVSACMDLTDGLAKDLLALLAENTAAAIFADSLPIHPDAHRAATESGKSILHHAFCDGEDYELLFILDASTNPHNWCKSWSKKNDTPVSCIGKIVTSEKPHIMNADSGEPLSFGKGYSHFAR